MHINAEIKSICRDAGFIRDYLLSHGAEFRGTDFQTDTYFNTNKGRLKLREGNIEVNLIYYERDNKPGTKDSFFRLIAVDNPAVLKEVLSLAMGIKIVVEKKREIYYIKNVKFHIDEVPGLGSFVEIEAGNIRADLNKDQLREQCDFYIRELGIESGDMISVSYSDMLMEKMTNG